MSATAPRRVRLDPTPRTLTHALHSHGGETGGRVVSWDWRPRAVVVVTRAEY